MARWLAGVVLAACAYGAQAAAAQQQPPSFRGRSDAVRVFVTVTDRDGRLVTTLTQDQFEVRDDGKPQPIVLFDNSPQPIRIIVMLDVSGSMEGNLELLREASEELFARLRKDDLARVGTFGTDVSISSPFTHDAAALRAALPATMVPDAPTPLWRALDEAMEAFGHEGDERRVDPRAERRQGQRSHRLPTAGRQPVGRDRSRAQRRRDDLRGRPAQPAPADDDAGPRRRTASARRCWTTCRTRAWRAWRRRPAAATSRFAPGDDLGEAFARVADELHAQYLLGFAPPKRDGKVHDVDVRVSRPRGMKPRARKTYVAPRE